MFIKKDLRKIDVILKDPESIPFLKLARRPAEWNGSLKTLINSSNIHMLTPLETLSVYESKITDISALSKLEHTSIKQINVGRNPITSIPSDLALLDTLKDFWADDCEVAGELPAAFYGMSNLEQIRMSGNKLTHMDDSKIAQLKNLKVLCLDNNQITELPPNLGKLKALESLLVRSNLLVNIPEVIFSNPCLSNLKLLHLSSNKLTSLPDSLVSLSGLETLYANGNQIAVLPVGFGTMEKLKKLQLANNKISELPSDFTDRFGVVEGVKGLLLADENCNVNVIGNPIVNVIVEAKKKQLKEEQAAEKRRLETTMDTS